MAGWDVVRHGNEEEVRKGGRGFRQSAAASFRASRWKSERGGDVMLSTFRTEASHPRMIGGRL